MTTFTSTEELKTEVLARLNTRLKDTSNVDADVLSGIVDSVTDEVESIRNYPSTYTDEMKIKDMGRFVTNITELALYDFNQIGAEGETAHSENGISRTYKDRNACLKGVRPISVVL